MRIAGAALLALAACQPMVDIEWTAPLGTQSFIVALDDPQCNGRSVCGAARAYAGAELRAPFSLPNGDYQIYLLAYPTGLDALGLIEGPLPSCRNVTGSPMCQPGDPLPIPDNIFASQIAGQEATAFQPVPMASEAIVDILLPRLPPEECANRGRCFLDETRSCEMCGEPPAVLAPQPPSSPASFAPVVFECPAEWTSDGQVCVPPEADPLPAGCGSGYSPVFGSARCEPLGDTCPVGQDRFSPLTPPDAVYVDAGAAMGGDGTLGAPFRTIQEALVVAPEGSTISLARGVYTGCTQAVDQALLGACAGETRIDASACPVELRGRSALRNVSVDGLLTITAGADVQLRGVEVNGTADCIRADDAVVEMQSSAVRGCGDVGLRVTGGRLLLDRFYAEGVVRGIKAIDVDVAASRIVASGGEIGVEVIDGSRGTMERILAERTGEAGLSFDGAYGLIVEDVRVRDTDASNGKGARAIRLGATRENSLLTMREVVIERSAQAGIAIEVAGTSSATLVLADVYIADVRSTQSNVTNYGFFARGDMNTSVQRMSISGAEHYAASVNDRASVSFDQLVVREGAVRSQRALDVRRAEVSLKNADFSGLQYHGLTVGTEALGVDTGGHVSLENVHLRAIGRDVGPQSEVGPSAIFVASDASIDASRVRIEDIDGTGLIFGTGVFNPGPVPSQLQDIFVADVRAIGIPFSRFDGVALYSTSQVFGARLNLEIAEQAIVVDSGVTQLSSLTSNLIGRVETKPAIRVESSSFVLTDSFVWSADVAYVAQDSTTNFTSVEMRSPVTARDSAAIAIVGGDFYARQLRLDGMQSHGEGLVLCRAKSSAISELKVTRFTQGAAVGIYSSQVAGLDRFDIDSSFVGLHVSEACLATIGDPVELIARDGIVRAQDTGMRVESRTWDASHAMTRVQFQAMTPVVVDRDP